MLNFSWLSNQSTVVSACNWNAGSLSSNQIGFIRGSYTQSTCFTWLTAVLKSMELIKCCLRKVKHAYWDLAMNTVHLAPGKRQANPPAANRWNLTTISSLVGPGGGAGEGTNDIQLYRVMLRNHFIIGCQSVISDCFQGFLPVP